MMATVSYKQRGLHYSSYMGGNYDLVLTHEVMRAQVCSFMKEKWEMPDVDWMRLDNIRLEYRDPRPIPPDVVVLEPPHLSFYDFWING